MSATKQTYISNNQACLTGYDDGLLVINVPGPSSPETTTLFKMPTGSQDVQQIPTMFKPSVGKIDVGKYLK